MMAPPEADVVQMRPGQDESEEGRRIAALCNRSSGLGTRIFNGCQLKTNYGV